MKRFLFTVAMLTTAAAAGLSSAWAQEMPIADMELYNFFKSIKPDYTMKSKTLQARRDGAAKSKALRSERPDHVNNQATIYFPPIFNQSGGSCGSSANVAYMLCYELNTLRNQDGKHNTDYQFPSHFTWLTCSNTCSEQTMAERNGIPSVTDYGGQTYSKYFGLQDTEEKDVGWMQGYDKWYRAMFNRARTMAKFPYTLDTEEGIELAKDWLWNHNGDPDFQTGGVFVIGVAAGPEFTSFPNTPTNQECGVIGKHYVTTWGPQFNHALTVVGYDDRVEFDLDGNGVIGEEDKGEKGAWIIANSWGQGWVDEGTIYCPYEYTYCVGLSGSTWDPSFYHARKNYRPLRTIKLTMDHSHRPEILLGAGIAQDTSAAKPEETTTFAHFNYTGSAKAGSTEIPMLGRWADGYHYEPMEFGYDLTDLTASFDRTKPLKYFFYIDTKYSSKGTGNIYQASIIDYELDPEGVEIPFRIDTVAILNRGNTTMISVTVPGEQAYKPLNLTLNDNTLRWVAPQKSCLPLKGYAIYNGSAQVATVDAETLSYNTADENGSNTYTVAAIYEVNGYQILSDKSNRVRNTQIVDLAGNNTVLEMKGTSCIIPGAIPESMQKATIEFWINPYTTTNYNQQIGPAWGTFLFHTTSSSQIVVGWNTGSDRITSASNTLPANKWTHVAITINNNVMNLYVNGERKNTLTSSIYSGLSGFGNLNIGDGYYGFNGCIDEFRVWNTCRSQQQINDGMNTRIANPASQENLIVYLGMDKIQIEEGIDGIAELAAGNDVNLAGVGEYAFIQRNDLFSGDNAQPSVAFALSNDTVVVGQSVSAIPAVSLNATELKWTAQGANTAETNISVPTFIYNEPGTYTVALQATNAQGVTATAEQKIEVVAESLPVADFEIGAVSTPAGDKVSLINRSTSTGCTYKWEMPGAASSAQGGSNASAVYSETGSHPITLHVTNGAGTTSVTKYVTITNAIPNVDFDILPSTVIVGDEITAIDKTKYSPKKWNWDFSNSRHTIGINGQNFTYKTEYPGYYDVTLTATNEVGTGTATKRKVLAVSNADPGNGLAFAGNGEQVTTKSPVNEALTGFTIEDWLYPYSVKGALDMATEDGSLNISTDENGETTITLSNKSVSSGEGYIIPNEWHHYAIVYRAGAIVFYRDGENFYQPTARLALKTTAWTGNFVIGNKEAPFRGIVDEFRFWNKALSQSDIQARCNQPIDNIAEEQARGLVIYYDFNQSTGNVNSATGEEYTGTRSGFGPDGDAWSSSLGVFTLDFSPLPQEKDITADYLTNYKAPFLHTDERVNTTNYVSRYYQLETGTDKSGWILENTVTEGDITTGAYVDSYFNYSLSAVAGSLGFASAVTDQRTYQTINLPAGMYRLEIKEHSKAFSPGGSYIVVTEADTLAGNADINNTLAYTQLSEKVLEFLVREDSQISLGFIFNLNSNLAVAIEEIKLIQVPYEFHDFNDLTNIDEVKDNAEKSKDSNLYDLQGRRINGKPKTGIYIRNGKKVLQVKD